MICFHTNFIPTGPLLSCISIPAATSTTRFRKSSFRRGTTARGARNRRGPRSSTHAGVGICLCEDLDRDFHGEVIRCSSYPRALQGNRLARLLDDRDAHEILIPHPAARRIEVDPARAGNVDLYPGVGVAAGDKTNAVIGKVQISGNKPRTQSKRAERRDHEHGKIPTTPAHEYEGLDWVLDTFVVPRHVLEGPVDSLRHVDEKVASVRRSVRTEEARGPVIERRTGGQRRDEAHEAGPFIRPVSERIGSRELLDIGLAEPGRRVVETNSAFEAKLRSSVFETGGRDMIAEDIPRPGEPARLRPDFEFGFEYLLVLIVARTQHHAVLAESDRSLIVICRDVPYGEDRHCNPTMLLVSIRAFFAPT